MIVSAFHKSLLHMDSVVPLDFPWDVSWRPFRGLGGRGSFVRDKKKLIPFSVSHWALEVQVPLFLGPSTTLPPTQRSLPPWAAQHTCGGDGQEIADCVHRGLAGACTKDAPGTALSLSVTCG